MSDVRPDDVRTIRDSGRKDFIIRLSEGLTRCKMASRLPDVGFLLREIMHEKYGIQRPIPQPLPEPQQPSRAELCHICREEAARNALDVDLQHANNVRHHNMYTMTELSAVDNFSVTYIFYFACCT